MFNLFLDNTFYTIPSFGGVPPSTPFFHPHQTVQQLHVELACHDVWEAGRSLFLLGSPKFFTPTFRRLSATGPVTLLRKGAWQFWGNVCNISIYENSFTRWVKVTFWSPSWRSLNHWKGHLTIPKRSQRIARYLFILMLLRMRGNLKENSFKIFKFLITAVIIHSPAELQQKHLKFGPKKLRACETIYKFPFGAQWLLLLQFKQRYFFVFWIFHLIVLKESATTAASREQTHLVFKQLQETVFPDATDSSPWKRHDFEWFHSPVGSFYHVNHFWAFSRGWVIPIQSYSYLMRDYIPLIWIEVMWKSDFDFDRL